MATDSVTRNYSTTITEGIEFVDMTPAKFVTLYRLENGEPVLCTDYRVVDWCSRTDANGNLMFTQRKEEAPEWVLNDTKCFLAKDSPERLDGSLEKAGLGSRPFCPAVHLNAGTRSEHAFKRHKTENARYQEWKFRERDEVMMKNQLASTEALLKLAGHAAQAQPEVSIPFSQVTDSFDTSSNATITTTSSDVAITYDDFVKADAEAAHAAPWHEGLSNKQLRAMAEVRGIQLGTKYVKSDDIIAMIEKAES